MNPKRPKIEPIRNATLFEMEKLEEAPKFASELKIERQYSLPGILLGTSAFTAAFCSKMQPRNSYIFDAEGRVAEKHVRFGAYPEMITKITYNDHGDKMEEHTTMFGDMNDAMSEEESESSSQESYSRYSYQYDSFGNWTEQTISYGSGTNDLFKISAVRHQTITYY